MKIRITMPMHDTRNRRYPIRARLLFVVAGILLLAGLPAGTGPISSAAPAAARPSPDAPPVTMKDLPSICMKTSCRPGVNGSNDSPG